MTVTAAIAAEPRHAGVSPAARTALWASVVGTTIEWYDFFLYATAASLIFDQAFFPNRSSFVGTLLAFATFAVGFVVRPIGGFIFGHIGDTVGRKKTLALTMFLMGGATALMGALPTAAQIGSWAPVLLLTLRIVQGLALGGEWAGAVLLAVEHAPPHRRGLFGSIPQIGTALGLALGTGVFALLQVSLSVNAFRAYGWRIAFLLSIVLVLFGVVVRLRITETPAFQRIRDSGQRAAVPLREVFTPPALRLTVLGLLSRWGEGAAFNTWGVFAIAYATKTLGLAKVPVLISVTAAALLMVTLLPAAGLLVDRFGPKRVYASGIAAYVFSVFPAFAIFGTKSLGAFAVTTAVAFGGIYALFYGAQGTLYASLFPAPIRYTGLSTVYQLSGVYASGLTPLILTVLIGAAGGVPWLACGYLAATGVISLMATLLLKPTPLQDI